MKKRTNLSIIAVAIMVILTTTGSVWAFSGSGSGTQVDPYVITDVYQLQEMRDDLGAYYVLCNDIDASDTATWNDGAGFEPVGTEATPFTGKFDGCGYTVMGLYINRPSTDGVGLLGYIREGAEVKNIGLDGVDITARRNSGSLVGNSHGSTICHSWSSGNVRGSYDYQMRLGGLLGVSSGTNSYVYHCFSNATVTATGGAHQVGGLAGYNGHGSVMSDCYATGNVSGSWKVGGLVGDNIEGSEGTLIERCYSAGKVSGNGGGLVGHNWHGGVTRDSYWDKQTSGKSSSCGGIGKATTEMMQRATFVGWNFDEIWDIDEGQSYPFFMEPRVLIGLEIVGPDNVAEDSETQYQIIAKYDNGTTKDVARFADWSVEPSDVASVNAGLLTTEGIDLPTDVTITAEYGEGDNVQVVQKDVSILAICPSTGALKFDGVDDYVEVGNYEGITGSNPRTSTAWIRTSEHDTVEGVIVSWGKALVSGGQWRMSVTDGKLKVGVGVGAAIGETSLINDGFWHHVAAVYSNEDKNGDNSVDLGDVELYVDGNPQIIINAPARAIHTVPDYNLMIGEWFQLSQWTTHELFFNGFIDDVCVYDRALSAQEIQTLMHTRPDTDDPNLVGYWDFNEGDGQVAYDSSMHGHDGILGSTPEVDDNDPIWIEPGAPSICTLEGIVERNLSDIWNAKVSILEQLYEVMTQEAALMDYMNEKFADRDFGDTSTGDVVKAKQKIHSAIQDESQAGSTIDQSLDKLDDAMNTLGIELDFDSEPIE